VAQEEVRSRILAKVNDSESEAAETQTWLQFAVECAYLTRDTGRELYREYDRISGMLVRMTNKPEKWTIG
jgi:four helix bundle protein